jgi:hypothetical protein
LRAKHQDSFYTLGVKRNLTFFSCIQLPQCTRELFKEYREIIPNVKVPVIRAEPADMKSDTRLRKQLAGAHNSNILRLQHLGVLQHPARHSRTGSRRCRSFETALEAHHSTFSIYGSPSVG